MGGIRIFSVKKKRYGRVEGVDDISRGERRQRRRERKAGGGGERATAVLDGYNAQSRGDKPAKKNIEMCAGTHGRSETLTDKWQNEWQRTSGKTNGNGQTEKRMATDKWKNEWQRTSGKTNGNGGKTNGNGQVEKRMATDKWKNEWQRTSVKTNGNKILT